MPAVLAAALLFSSAPAESGAFPARVLDIHNAERQRLAVAPLSWDEDLARDAADWARVLARKGHLEHSSQRSQGENLWMGTRGHYSPEHMIGAFVGERSQFRAGRFPAVSRTGNWADVGHYTQLIWPGTQKVGCALASDGRWDVLVCRYWPAGNVMGRMVP